MNKIKEANTKPKKKRYKYIIYIVLILSLTTLVLYFSLRGTITYNGEELPTFVAIGKIFTEIDVGYLFVFFGLLLLNNLLGAFALFLFARLYTRKYKYHQALANQMIGVFYNDITPGSNSGGQFAQAITFKKQGMNISNAASVMVMQFIVYQSCLFILGLISLFKIDTILDIQIIRIGSVDIPIIIFIIFGFLLNLIVISSMYFMSYSRWFHNLITNNLMDLLGKMHLIKNVEEKKLQLRVQVENFRIEDSLPSEVRLQSITTGTFNEDLKYKVTYTTNKGNTKTIATNLSTQTDNTIDFTKEKLADDEYITKFTLVFDSVKSNFKSTKDITVVAKVIEGLEVDSTFKVSIKALKR